MKTFTVKGSSVDKAVKEFSLKKGIPINYFDVKVIEEGSKGIFGLGRKMCEVIITFDDVQYYLKKSKMYISDILSSAGFDFIIDSSVEEDSFSDGSLLYLNISSTDSRLLIGKSGSTLDSFQYLLERAMNIDYNDNVRLLVDVDGYRKGVINSLKEKALKIAKDAQRLGKSGKLPPMPAAVRREIHIVVESVGSDVYTVSKGEGGLKAVYILSNSKRETSAQSKQSTPKKGVKKISGRFKKNNKISSNEGKNEAN